MRNIVLSMLLLAPIFCAAQPITWQKQLGFIRDDVPFDAIQCHDGGFIIAANSKSFSTINQWGDYNFGAYIIKLDSLGNIQWTKFYKDGLEQYVYSITETMDNGFAFTGYKTNNSSDFFKYIYILKIDSNGNKLWEKNYGYPHSFENNSVGNKIIEIENGELVVGGNIKENNNLAFYYFKTDSLGNIILEKRLKKKNIYNSIIDVICSQNTNDLVFKGFVSNTPNYFTTCFFMTNRNLDTIWYLIFPDSTIFSTGSNVCQFNDSLFVSIDFKSSFSINFIGFSNNGKKLFSTNKQIYSMTDEGDMHINPFYKILKQNEMLWVYGSFSNYNDSVAFMEWYNTFLLKMDINASIHLKKTICQSSTNVNKSNFVLTNDGGIFALGVISKNLTAVWQDDILALKLDSNGENSNEFLKTESYISGDERISVFPNPFNDYIEILGQVNEKTNGSIEIFDLTGKSVLKIFEGEFEKDLIINMEVKTEMLCQGMYYVLIKSEKFNNVVKMIKMY